MKECYLTLAAIVRNEEHYVWEWILSHHVVGFERFAVVLHRCTDNTKQKLTQLAGTLGLDIRIHETEDEGKVQMGAYRWLVRQYGPRTKWMMFVDADEFVFSDEFVDLKPWLRRYERFGGVAVHQAVFGADNNVTRPLWIVADMFKRRLPLDHWQCYGIKSFFQPEKLIQLQSPHIQDVRDGNVRVDEKPFTLVDWWKTAEAPIHSPVRLNHYFTRSMQDWVERSRRGSCNDARTGAAYSVEEFFETDNACTEIDGSLLRLHGYYKPLLARLNGAKPSSFSERIRN